MSSTFPDDEGCLRILREEDCSERVIIHCCTVRELAVRVAALCGADLATVSSGALLHDLGRCREMGMMHAAVGASMAEDRGLSDELVEIIRRHIGAGIDDEEARALGLPPGDYFPRNLEQKVVAHADNLTSDDRLVPSKATAEKLRSRGQHHAAERVEALHSELTGLCGRDLDSLTARIGRRPPLTGPCARL